MSVSPAYRVWFWLTRTIVRRLASAVTALILVAGVTVGAIALDNWLNECSAGFYRGSAHECIGVTNSYNFLSGQAGVPAEAEQQMSTVMGDIKTLDDSVTGRYATIALLLPVTSSDTPAIETVHDVEGAYLAVKWADTKDAETPRIRLVIANPGTDSDQWLPVAEQLASMTGAPDNLLAVTGIGVSTSQTQQEVAWLTSAAHDIPVVGGAITADDLANSPTATPYPGLARVEPTNSQEAQALTKYLASKNVSKNNTFLVEDDANADDPAKRDLYDYTLATQFAMDTAYAPAMFNSLAANVTNVIYDKAETICYQPDLQWIYFAGRQAYLTDFLNELHSACPTRSFTIVTGSAASHLVNDPNLLPSDFQDPGKLTLDYVPIAAPVTWTSVEETTRYSFMSATYENTFEPGFKKAFSVSGAMLARALADGQAMINYDASLTAIDAIQDATQGNIEVPSTADVSQYWPNLVGGESVVGATGLICLDGGGNPYDKAIPIMQYSPSGIPRQLGDPIFLDKAPTATAGASTVPAVSGNAPTNKNCQIPLGG